MRIRFFYVEIVFFVLRLLLLQQIQDVYEHLTDYRGYLKARILCVYLSLFWDR